jgi:hypothetical protein
MLEHCGSLVSVATCVFVGLVVCLGFNCCGDHLEDDGCAEVN